jgi:hypothetical protein
MMMTFPIANKGPFEDENKEWARHVAVTFVAGVTGPMLASEGCDPAHAAVAHFQGFLCCAFQDAAERGDGEQQIMSDILEQIRLFLSALLNGQVVAAVVDEHRPILTALTGGKKDKGEDS